jgi:hypothetical protein
LNRTYAVSLGIKPNVLSDVEDLIPQKDDLVRQDATRPYLRFEVLVFLIVARWVTSSCALDVPGASDLTASMRSKIRMLISRGFLVRRWTLGCQVGPVGLRVCLSVVTQLVTRQRLTAQPLMQKG